MTKKKTTAKTTTNDQPVTAATVRVTVAMTNIQRFHMLLYLNSKTWGFDQSSKMADVWDAILGDWNWDEKTQPVEMPRHHQADSREEWQRKEDEFRDASEERRKWFGGDSEVELDVGVMRDLRDAIRKKLEQAPPKEKASPGDEHRWIGRVALEMRRLYDELDRRLAQTK